MKFAKRAMLPLIAAASALLGCGGASTLFFNDAFVNSINPGTVVPLTPGPTAAFVFVRVVNALSENPVEFIVTAEKTVFARDDEGNVIRDELNEAVTERVLETHRLQTQFEKPANESGYAFACSEDRIEKIGLGENLLPTDSGAFINEGTQQIGGFGIPADIPPLDRSVGNFQCGDTIIFRAIPSSSTPGGVKIESFLLPFTDQPGNFSGPDTFGNLEDVREQQVGETP